MLQNFQREKKFQIVDVATLSKRFNICISQTTKVYQPKLVKQSQHFSPAYYDTVWKFIKSDNNHTHVQNYWKYNLTKNVGSVKILQQIC